MKRRKAALLAGLVAAWSVIGPYQAGSRPAQAQRAPLYGVWTGGMQCGRYIRIMQLFMYGNGTGLLLLGISPFTPNVKPAVATVLLRQPPDNDYVLIDRWISNGENPRPQLVGRLNADRTFEGKVLGDRRCDQIFFRPYDYPAAVLQNMAQYPFPAALREARKLNPPQMTAKDMLVLGIFAYAVLGGGGGGSSPSSGGRRHNALGMEEDDGPVFNPPSVGGDAQGNPLGRDVQGNVPRGNVQ